MKVTIYEMKNSLDGFNSRLYVVEDQDNKVKDR